MNRIHNNPVLQENKDCIFCNIVNGHSSCHKIWESSSHLAFLSIFPNTRGVTVVIPKKHFKSYAFELPEEEMISLVLATKQVALLLDNKLGANRTGMVFEGFGIDHVHAKLYPLHGVTTSNVWTAIESPDEKKNEYHHDYPGYITSHDGNRANDDELAALALKIRS